jgi:alkylation response protein AidB-like acyl-CoA dehydrogenase
VLCLVEHDPSTVVVEEVGLLGARALRVADVAFVNARPVAIEPVNRDSLIFIFSVLSLLTGACACATSAKALDTAREYARERYQGGRMIEDHDAIKLLIETNRAAIQSAWKGVLDSAAGFDQGSTDGIASCFRAKAAASRAAVNAGLDAIQVYGGYGYMRDYGVEKRFRDAAALSVLPLDSTRLLLLSSMLAG